MPLARTKEMDLVSSEYHFISPVTDGATTYSAGEVVEISATSGGFVLVDVPINTQFTLITAANQVRALKAAEAISAGDPIYWDNGNSVVTKVAGGLTKIGEAIEGALLGDDTVLFDFNARGLNIIP